MIWCSHVDRAFLQGCTKFYICYEVKSCVGFKSANRLVSIMWLFVKIVCWNRLFLG